MIGRRFQESAAAANTAAAAATAAALLARREQRARMDDLMRHPGQLPAPPRKAILRRRTTAALLPCAKHANAENRSRRPASREASSQLQGAAGECDVAHSRAVWREGLKQHIARQREAARGFSTQLPPREGEQSIGSCTMGSGCDQGGGTDALSWSELKLAAQEGFEELLRHQQAAAATDASSTGSPGTWRRPGMTRPRGGGPCATTAVAPQGVHADSHSYRELQSFTRHYMACT
jgi:hypothetical protein